MKYILAMNGPKEIGKSWLCDALLDMLKGSSVSKESLMAIPWNNLIEAHSHEWPYMEDYHRFKSHLFPDGETGRTKIINYVEKAREENPTVWIEAWLNSLENSEEDHLYLIESLGFKIERDYFESLGHPFSVCVIAPTNISVHKKFDEEDSRVALKPTARMRFLDSQMAFDKLQRRIEYARGKQDDITKPLTVAEIWQAIHMG